MQKYKNIFYDNLSANSFSADVIVGILLTYIKPNSVVDVGCGTGIWLNAFKNNGVIEILGIDGSYINREQLKINESEFIRHNLEEEVSINKRFDMAISVEVAEHISEEKAITFIRSLTKLSDIVLFSAAIPFQGGTNHVNEQWPVYWVNIFNKFGYEVVDFLRKEIWNIEEVRWFYKQNILLFVKSNVLKDNSKLYDKFINDNLSGIPLVHPQKYLKVIYYNKLDKISYKAKFKKLIKKYLLFGKL